VAKVVLGGNEVLDGVWGITANLQVRSSVSMVPCNGDGAAGVRRPVGGVLDTMKCGKYSMN
jgi:hypothetical protein